MFWRGLALGICIGLIVGAFLWTALAIRTAERKQARMDDAWIRQFRERAGR
jgi:hypothetical protein